MLKSLFILCLWLALPLAAEVSRSGAVRVSAPQGEGWTHLELGAANYKPGDPAAYKVLNDFLDEYVKLNGPKGTLLLNDMVENTASLEEIATALRKRADSKGWNELKLELLPGDFTKLRFPRKLNTISLRNPQAPEVTSLKATRETADFYAKLASKTSDGLLLTSYFYLEMAAIKEIGSLKMESHGRGRPYLLPDGWTVPNPTFNFLVAGKNPPAAPLPGTGQTADDALYEKSVRFDSKDPLSSFIRTNLNLQPEEGFLAGGEDETSSLGAPSPFPIRAGRSRFRLVATPLHFGNGHLDLPGDAHRAPRFSRRPSVRPRHGEGPRDEEAVILTNRTPAP